ncbi:MAG: beta-N-acetylhexosaminidase, partial [Rubrivivax sp.]|nr:beta-N-acetylhexosaminidase [Rubrivivax sp.]
MLLAVGGLLLILGLIALGATIWVATLLARSLSEAGEAPAQAGSSATAASPGQVAIQPPPLPTWTPRPAIPTPPPRPTSAVDIDGLLNAMSLEEKVGQMIMTGIPGRAFDAQTAQLIETYHFGSVVYFAENTANPGQTRRLSQELQRAAAGAAHGIPLLIAIDHEGGRVHRFGQGLTHFANPMALGAAASPELAYQAAAAAARELLAVGINVSLAPVLDINDEPLNPVIGVRAFGGSPDLVTLMGMAYLRGLQDQGVIAAAKHFPGHGSTIEDSHFTLPIVNKTEAQLAQNELLPFQAAIRNQVGVIQVAHVAYPQLDPSGAPASLSPLLVQGRLRDELGFDGVVMTDAMSMGAITNRYSVEQAAQLAALAGNDLLAYPQAEMAIAAYQAILAGARDGTIPQSRIEEAARRGLRLKQRYDLFANAAPPALE